MRDKIASVSLEMGGGGGELVDIWEGVIGVWERVRKGLMFSLGGIMGKGVVRASGEAGVVGRREMKVKMPNKKLLGYGVLLIVVLFLIVFGWRQWGGMGKSGGEAGEGQPKLVGARASEGLGREFTFPLRNSKGEEVNRIKFFLDKAELRDQIIVKGQKATAVAGRTFLIVNIKVTNEYDQRVEIDTRDYVRLSVNGNKEEWLAPDIHNDPVEVQAISTKITRVGFPINASDQELVLRVGEVSGEKTEMPLSMM